MLGKRIGGRYELLSVLGGGGMAVVYKARDLILDRLVAVKILRSEFSDDDEFIRRFRREAQSVASLFHPNIIDIYDIGDDTSDVYYIVMEYVEGETLKDLIKREAPLELGPALHIMDEITAAIEHAHEQGIIHRDIKPHNILIGKHGDVKVTDFGIAIAMTSATITHTNSVLGSAHYFSPEQARGGYANTKSDIYSLGIVLFEMLTGELPFSGTSPVSVALKHLQEDIPDPRELNHAIPQSVENIITKALSKDPNHRYQKVADMREDLKTALDPERLNEPKFIEPDDEDQTTKIMAPVTGGSSGNANGGKNGSGRPNHEDDGGHKKKRKKRRFPKWLWIILLLLLLLGGAAVAAFSLIPSLLHVDNVTVPDVVGKDIGDARALLAEKHLQVHTEKVYSNKDKGKVVRQNPRAQTTVKKNYTVELSVSKGPEKITLDNYIGKDKDTVEQLTKDEHFKDVQFKGEYSDTYPEGQVFDQNPSAGTKVVPEDTVLVFTYSIGTQKVEVPDLSGKTKEEADAALEDSGLSSDYQGEEYSDSVEEGKVIKQSPDPGTEVDPNSTVAFTISKGSEPEQNSGSDHGSDSDSEKNPDQPPRHHGPTPPGPGPDQPPSDHEQQPIDFHQPIRVDGPGRGKPADVKIVYSDANHDREVFKEEKVKGSKRYDLPMTVDPGGKVTVWVYVDGKLNNQFSKTYEQVSDETGGGEG
jgi:serine/threonine-protein kinase